MIFFSRQDTAYQSGGGFSPTEPLFCVSSNIFLEILRQLKSEKIDVFEILRVSADIFRFR